MTFSTSLVVAVKLGFDESSPRCMSPPTGSRLIGYWKIGGACLTLSLNWFVRSSQVYSLACEAGIDMAARDLDGREPKLLEPCGREDPWPGLP